jgi:hypothetical protein
MSGAITLGTIAAIGSAAVGAGSLAYGIVNGQAQSDAQSAALKKQNTAQQTAQGQALSTERQAAVAQGAANQQTPDITSILKKAATSGTGLSSTMLTGPGGVDTSSLSLGKATLLGA